MMVYRELSGAAIVRERHGCLSAINRLVEGCSCLYAEFVACDDQKQTFDRVEDAFDYVITNPKAVFDVAWSCPRGYLSLRFCDDGALVIAFSRQNTTLEQAVAFLEFIMTTVAAERGYVSLDLVTPWSSEEFGRLFGGVGSLYERQLEAR